MSDVKLTVAFESGHIEAEKGTGLAGEWEFSFFTDTEDSYISCDVSEATLRSLLAFIEVAGGGRHDA